MLGQILLALGRLSLGQLAVLDCGIQMFFSVGNEGLDEDVCLDALILGDVGQTRLAVFQLGAQLRLGEAQRFGGNLEVIAPGTAQTAPPRSALWQLLVEGFGDLVGLLLGQCAVLDEAAEGALDVAEAARHCLRVVGKERQQRRLRRPVCWRG